MNGNKTINELAKFSPVLVLNLNAKEVENAQIVPANISSKNLGIIVDKDDAIIPYWIEEMIIENKHLLVIDKIDSIDFEEQEKFYEILKYKTISSIKFDNDLRILVSYENLDKVSPNICALCQIVR